MPKSFLRIAAVLLVPRLIADSAPSAAGSISSSMVATGNKPLMRQFTSQALALPTEAQRGPLHGEVSRSVADFLAPAGTTPISITAWNALIAHALGFKEFPERARNISFNGIEKTFLFQGFVRDEQNDEALACYLFTSPRHENGSQGQRELAMLAPDGTYRHTFPPTAEDRDWLQKKYLPQNYMSFLFPQESEALIHQASSPAKMKALAKAFAEDIIHREWRKNTNPIVGQMKYPEMELPFYKNVAEVAGAVLIVGQDHWIAFMPRHVEPFQETPAAANPRFLQNSRHESFGGALERIVKQVPWTASPKNLLRLWNADTFHEEEAIYFEFLKRFFHRDKLPTSRELKSYALHVSHLTNDKLEQMAVPFLIKIMDSSLPRTLLGFLDELGATAISLSHHIRNPHILLRTEQPEISGHYLRWQVIFGEIVHRWSLPADSTELKEDA